MVHEVDSPKELAVAVCLLPKVLFGHNKAAFSFGCSGFCLGYGQFSLTPTGLRFLSTLD